ncbi:MAG: inner membrane-spanning protein YciB [Planktomarina sp.]
MSQNTLPKWVKPVLEFGPIAAFFIAYLKLKDQVFEIAGIPYDGFVVVTALFIPVIWVSTGLLWWLTGKISKMQILTAALVTIFGGLSVWFNDGSFIKMKPTMIYLIFTGILGFGLLRGQSYLKSVMEDLMPLEHEGWMKLTKRSALFFLGLAILNEVIWRGFSEQIWVYFKTFGLPSAMVVFLLTQYSLFTKYAKETDS